MKHAAQLLLLFSMFAHGGNSAMLTDLANLQSKNRIIVVDNAQDTAHVLALFEKSSAAIDDRDIVWFVIEGDRIVSNYSAAMGKALLGNIREKYRLRQGETILIGKDGGIKSRSDRMDLANIFSDIDAMPMRQREMQN